MAESKDWAIGIMVPVIRREPSGSFQVLPAHKPERTCISASFEYGLCP
jgi:hypothetical protein